MASTSTSVQFQGNKGAETCGIQYTRHADDSFTRQAGNFLCHVDHGVERIGNDDDDRVLGVLHDLFGNAFNDIGVDFEQVRAVLARFARNAGSDDDDVGIGGIFVVVGPGDDTVECQQAAGLLQVERFTLRDAFRDIDQHHVSEVFVRGQLSHGGAHLSGADYGNPVPFHRPSPLKMVTGLAQRQAGFPKPQRTNFSDCPEWN